MAMDNIEANRANPPGSEALNNGDNRIRELTADVADSFPGMTGNATDAVVTDAGSGGSPTGPQIAFAANTYDSARDGELSQVITDTAAQTVLITNNANAIADLQAQQEAFGGEVTGVGSGTLTVTGPSGWTATDGASTGRVVVTHSLGRKLYVTGATLNPSPVGTRCQVEVMSSGLNSFEVLLTTDNTGQTRDFHFTAVG